MYDPATHSSLPFLTTQFEPIQFDIKESQEDFFVEEMPLYQASGQGTHVYIQIEKKGIGTMEAISKIATDLHITRKEIGYAGLKDARAVTRQWISIEHIDPEKIKSLDIPNIKIVKLDRHVNKIKLGHLACNRFVLRLRNLSQPVKDSAKIIESVMAVLAEKGVPNYFGSQRFGVRSETHLLGEAIAKGKVEEFMDMFLGKPELEELDTFSTARALYEKGDYEKAAKTWPYSYSNQRRALKVLIAKNGNKKKAYHVIDKNLKSFFVSAFQSDFFNQVLACRMPDINKIYLGDMAYKHVNGACFRVEDAAAEQPRCDAFEISPTGPILGGRMTKLAGPAGEIENAVLEKSGLSERDFEQMTKFGGKGGRRPLRFKPENPKVSYGQDQAGPYIELEFQLDSGCYATSLLREISKKNI